MADFSIVTTRLATGAAISSPEDVDALIRAGVTHVIDCRAEFDDGALLAGRSLVYLWNPTADDGQPKPDFWWQTSLEFALTARTRFRTMVYAHCAAGVNRGPSTAYGILRALDGLSPDDAMGLIKRARPQAGVAYAADFERFWASPATTWEWS